MQEPIVQTRIRPKGEKRRRPWGLLAWVGGVLIALTVIPFFLLRPKADTYTLRSYDTAIVQSGTLVDYVRGSGSVVPRLERTILAPVEGTLAEWLVAEGDEVTEGATLGTLTSKTLGQEVADTEKEVQSGQLNLDKLRLEHDNTVRQETFDIDLAQTTLQNAETELATTQKLFDIGDVSKSKLAEDQQKVIQAQKDLENKQLSQQNAERARVLALQEAQLKLEQAQAKLNSTQEKQTQLTLTAPVTGRVMKLSATVGQTVQSQAVLATVASSSDVRVVAKFPEVQASRLSVGQVANLKIANIDYKGSVTQISPNAESGQNGPVVSVILSFDTVPQGIRIGASSSVEIEVGRKDDALFLPRGAYLSTGGERFVYLINANAATRTETIFGLVDGNKVEVREGLELGNKVIVSSYESFKDKVEIMLVTEGEIKRVRR
jgi:HlyD family secretion protein